MLKKKNRLVSDYEYNRVYRQGKRVNSGLFDLIYLDVKDYNDSPKIGIVVSNKFSKVAPKRNKVKRVFREIVKENLEDIPDGYWVVIIPKTSSQDTKYEKINTEFNKTLSKIPFAG